MCVPPEDFVDVKAERISFQFPAVGDLWLRGPSSSWTQPGLLQTDSPKHVGKRCKVRTRRSERHGWTGLPAPNSGILIPRSARLLLSLRTTLRVLCFRHQPIFLGWSPAPPIPPVIGRGFRVKVDQFPSLARTRAFGPPGMTDSSLTQSATLKRGLRQGRYTDETLGPIALRGGGGASRPASNGHYRHSFCQIKNEEGRPLN